MAHLGLPTRVETSELLASWPFVASDKKMAHGLIKLPVVTAAGESHIERMPLDDLRRVLAG
jgi:3-dehydroquinate synthetase